MSCSPPVTAVVAGIVLVLVATQESAGQTADPLRASYERAQAFQLAGELDRAEAEYRTGVLPRALRRLGNLGGAEGRSSEAVELLQAAQALASDVETQTDLAVALLRAGELAPAGSAAAAAVAAAPRHARARSVLGRIYLLQGDAAGAARELRQSLSDEGRFETAYALALASLRLAQGEAARALFDQLLSNGPNPDILVLVGRAYLEAGDAQEAATHFGRALAQRADTRRAHYFLGLAHLAGKAPDRIARARAAFEAELTIDSADAPARRALDLLDAGRAGDLLEATRSVILDMLPSASSADAPGRAALRAQLTDILRNTWHNLAVIHTRRGNTTEAAQAARAASRWTVAVASTPDDPPFDAAPALAKADGLLRDGRYEEAEREIWTVLARAPDSPAGIRLLGLVRAAQRRHDEAEALLRRAVELDPAQQDAWISLAEIYAAGDEPRRALDALDRVPTEHQNPSAGVRVLAWLALGELDAARRLLPAAAVTAPPARSAEIVQRLLERDLLDEAEAFLGAAGAPLGVDADLLIASARLRARRKDIAGAEADLERALAADAGAVDALRMLADLAVDRGDHDRATDLLARAREAAPDAPELLEALARTAARAARLEEALDAARRLAAIRPDDPEARYLLGITLLQNQSWTEAVAAFDRAPPGADTDPRWPLGLGLAQFGRRDYAAARTAFEGALRLDAGQVEAHYHLGLIAREQGRTADAVAQMEQAVRLAPSHVAALTELGGLYFLQNDLSRARTALERAVRLDEGAPGAHYQLALIYARLGDTERARISMERFQKAREKMLARRERL